MSPDEAHALLNAAQSGQAMTLQQINEALLATGDLLPIERSYVEPNFSEPWITEPA